MNYRFVINREASQSYDESGIRKLIELNLVGPDTLAWCEGMNAWQPAGQIPELAKLFPSTSTEVPIAVPPPIPNERGKTAAVPPHAEAGKPSDEGYTGSPPPIDRTSPVSTGIPPVLPNAGGNGLRHCARQFVYFFFRPWNGRPSKVRDYVDADPRRVIPVAVALAVGLFFLFALAISPFVPDGPEPLPTGPPGMPANHPDGMTMEQWRIMRDAQRQTDNIIEDSYRYNRDSFDQQSETYRRGNYDWYTDRE